MLKITVGVPDGPNCKECPIDRFQGICRFYKQEVNDELVLKPDVKCPACLKAGEEYENADKL